ncbi:MAG: hypothetical protein UV61_C0002G0106 [Candidatus Gottesmanbacteria bacterium GW2011_GWB1_43_11]|uniref:Uncharacterized protein n=1 Tax=Candidatus Gottesmanbacteria bacterium GW2011_GWB1_43_11 TaxID=1618446 RepID=A0A0G1CNN6_9BACT|nr:MAG: hypothetical protein UV04_C0028G0019 [Candidatus Gottesmanbacteria bacterium GW2011_GWA2_42_16]KKS53476.1 MAG: hypothetical protein UV17_C0036G0006 [Candidatus Gottesmanbacteria bacterium GW2011_GWA1_42_26]KKS81809.1 MAG: hypothetical protein UV55_C0008G0024 [Candidatus Gottesmanbacteria bacterium GW2011_GWC1_43_10]KKS87385.1 MAG: hypothetical protein UV61_C0002G0106 [Candidatus Gottesmanbacteria bacterium GW2011_GWB1_43_11]OGG10527.1 MAG: hypothetical protein A2699_01925 [Candidatus Go
MHLSHRHYHYHHHDLQFFILLLLMTIGFVSFAKSMGQSGKQLQIIVITGLAYAFWGIFHHLYDRDLNWKIVVEYVAIAGLGVSLVWTLLTYIY